MVKNNGTINMNDIKFIDGKISDEERGYVMYRTYEDGMHVLMGSYTDKKHRGKGIFKTQLEKFLNEKVKKKEIVYIALVNKKILPYLLRLGFEKTKDIVPYWGKVDRSVNLKLIKG
jgi:hypothetical protein